MWVYPGKSFARGELLTSWEHKLTTRFGVPHITLQCFSNDYEMSNFSIYAAKARNVCSFTLFCNWSREICEWTRESRNEHLIFECKNHSFPIIFLLASLILLFSISYHSSLSSSTSPIHSAAIFKVGERESFFFNAARCATVYLIEAFTCCELFCCL